MSDELRKKLHSYQLDGANTELLKQAGAILIPELDGVLDAFYKRATAVPELAAFFDSPERMDFARSAQKAHWKRILTASFDEEYLASVERIGRVHARIDLPIEAYMSAYSLAASDLSTLFLKKSRRGFLPSDLDRVRDQVCTLNRAFSMDIERVVDTTFRVQAEEQTCAFAHINRAIDRLAEGDLTHVIPAPGDSDFPASFEPVRRKLNGATGKLGALLATVTGTMEQLLGIIAEVGGATDNLSSRTASQAASLEETAAAVQELTRNVEQSSVNTGRARDVASDAARTAEAGAGTVAEASDAMGRIQTSSQKITQIIGMIDDIAFQTNLLALNAGVEAARAGTAGRGFAVVAEEVRQLAGNASDAARQIKELVNASSGEVSSGVDLIHHAAETLRAIVANFDQVADLSTEIAAASHEQSTALSEVNSAIAQMDIVTQQNAAMVEQTTAATDRMNQEARGLMTQLGSLRVPQADPTSVPAKGSDLDGPGSADGGADDGAARVA